MQAEVSINIYNSKPDKNGHVVKTETLSIDPNPGSDTLKALTEYVQVWSDLGCRVEMV